MERAQDQKLYVNKFGKILSLRVKLRQAFGIFGQGRLRLLDVDREDFYNQYVDVNHRK